MSPAVAAAMTLNPVFDLFDCDRTGAIDSGQIDEHIFEVFRPSDRDRSHELSFSEFSRTVPRATEGVIHRLFQQADTNGNTTLSVKEFHRHLSVMLVLVDINHDGDVTRQELSASTSVPVVAEAL